MKSFYFEVFLDLMSDSDELNCWGNSGDQGGFGFKIFDPLEVNSKCAGIDSFIGPSQSLFDSIR